jgi:hypothetical protein
MFKSQFTIFLSMTVFGVVMLQGPVYVVRVVPAGTPVLATPGQQPPNGSAAPGLLLPETGHVPPAADWNLTALPPDAVESVTTLAGLDTVPFSGSTLLTEVAA